MRLIDADALMDELAVTMERNSELIDEWFAGCIEDTVSEMPTIAPGGTDIRAKLVQWAKLLELEGIGSKRLVRELIKREINKLDGAGNASQV